MLASKINYMQVGKGENVLFLHGWGGNISSFFVAQNCLSRLYHTINLDLMGFGESETFNANYDIYEYAIQIFLLLKKLDISKLSIVAHSFGGRIAIILSSIFDIQIDKLILVSSAGVGKKSLYIKSKIYLYKINTKIRNIFKLNIKENIGSKDYKKLDINGKSVFNKVVNQDLQYLLKLINSKTLIIWGNKDNITKNKESKIFKKHIANSKIVYLNGGHFAYINNHKIFNSIIYNFMGEK